MTIRVILADDHRLMRDGLRSVLDASGGFEVVAEAENGRDTVRLVRDTTPDLVVMDISMPELNGIDATSQISELVPTCKVLALSMHADEHLVRGMFQAGASGYMIKDSASEELLEAIRTVLSGRMYVSPDVTGVMVNDYVAHVSGRASTKEPGLSVREREVLQLIAEGHSTAQIGERLHVSVKTVETHRKRIMDKLEIRTVAGLTKYAIRAGISSVDDVRN